MVLYVLIKSIPGSSAAINIFTFLFRFAKQWVKKQTIASFFIVWNKGSTCWSKRPLGLCFVLAVKQWVIQLWKEQGWAAKNSLTVKRVVWSCLSFPYFFSKAFCFQLFRNRLISWKNLGEKKKFCKLLYFSKTMKCHRKLESFICINKRLSISQSVNGGMD